MCRHLIAKLRNGAYLNVADEAALLKATSATRHCLAHVDLVRAGDKTDTGFAVVQGWICRYKLSLAGKRQIVALLLPGDLHDPHHPILAYSDHSLATLTASVVAPVSSATLACLKAKHPSVARALEWSHLVEKSIAREWINSLGARPALPRFAHLLCELLVRLQAVGPAMQTSFHLPLRQEDLASILGVSQGHMHRTVQELRASRLISARGDVLTINDVAGLTKLAGFDPDYLHLSSI